MKKEDEGKTVNGQRISMQAGTVVEVRIRRAVLASLPGGVESGLSNGRDCAKLRQRFGTYV